VTERSAPQADQVEIVPYSKRYFREAPGTQRTYIHVRRSGSFGEQLALLFRDFLRTHSDTADDYARVKRTVAVSHRHDRRGYVEAKGPFVWEVVAKADDWAQSIG
jgi:GrpB-like predicted nucleotidyltransferase (UPF0157 family)